MITSNEYKKPALYSAGAEDVIKAANEIYKSDLTLPSKMRSKRSDIEDCAYYFLQSELGQPGSFMQHADNEQDMYYFLRSPSAGTKPFESEGIRRDFPILKRTVNSKPLIWLDNAATTQKPQCVIDALKRYYSEYNSNVHRGAHRLAKEATQAYEEAREKAAGFIGAQKNEIVFVRGTTEAINLVADSWGTKNIHEGDEIIITEMEHHSNIVPWQMLAARTGAVLKAVPVDDTGRLCMEEYARMLSAKTKLVAAAQVSNVLGTVNPIRIMADMAHSYGARMLVDGAQSVPHMPIDVKLLDADFFVFSGHKVYGPTGIGVLYAKKELLDSMPAYQTGGGMIESVTLSGATFQKPPEKFEAGTVNIADAIGLGAAIDYLKRAGMERIYSCESELTLYFMHKMSGIRGVRIIGTAEEKISVVSFVMSSVSPEAIARHLDSQGIAIRAGQHCAQPLHQRFGLSGTARASLGVYNTHDEIDTFVNIIKQLAV